MENSVFETDLTGVFRQEVVTYRRKGNLIFKEVITRNYYDDGDYNDSQTIIPMIVQEGVSQ